MPVLRKLRTFTGLPRPVRRAVPRAALALTLVSLGMGLTGFARCQRWLRRLGGDRTPAPMRETGPAEAGHLARALAVVAPNLPVRALCLERSLTLWWLLRRRRFDARLVIGVRRPEAKLEAHAWVELEGRPIGDRDDVAQRYAPFDGDVAAIASSVH